MAATVPDDFTPVETTNFNAVKALFVKYGLDIDPSLTREAAEGIPDLGNGSPFSITCQRGADNRTIWRMDRRQRHAPAFLPPFHSDKSVSSLSSASQFEDKDGNPLYGGDVLGAVLSTHPCFPSLGNPKLSAISSHTPKAAHDDGQDTIARPPFGPFVKFHPFVEDDWKRLRRSSGGSESSRTSVHVDADEEGPVTAFTLLQPALEEEAQDGEAVTKQTQSSSAASQNSRGRRKNAIFCNDPRYAVWAAPCPTDARALLQTSGPGAPAFLSSASESIGTRLSSTSECLCASQAPLPDTATETGEHDAIPPLRDYQRSALFPRQRAALIAASVERLVVQLTTVFDSRLHIDFFYTFRTFLSPHKLLDLLIDRFGWSLRPESPRDGHLRSVVRVRTYVVLKFWLTHFFEEDFLPDRLLRTKLTTWLNSFGEVTNRDAAEAGIITSLRKTVIKLKQLYTQAGLSGLLSSGTESPAERPQTAPESTSLCASATEVDLDRLSDPLKVARERSDARNAFGARQHRSQKPQLDNSPGLGPQAPPLGPLSRALNSTVLKIQKRVAQRRDAPIATTSPSSDTPSQGTDLLCTKGGLDFFLELFPLGQLDTPTRERSTSASSASEEPRTPGLDSNSEATVSTPATSLDLQRDSHPIGHNDNDNCAVPLRASSSDGQKTGVENLHHTTSEQTLRSPQRKLRPATSTSSSLRQQNVVAPDCPHATSKTPESAHGTTKTPGVVQIDDIDLSSDEDDHAVRKALRRLPGARDLRVGRQNMQSQRGSSALDGHERPAEDPSRSTRPPTQRDMRDDQQLGYLTTELFDPDEALAGYELVKGFNLEGFESDEDEPGDAEAALRKLEGYIDEGKAKSRARKVEALWQKSQASRLANGALLERPRGESVSETASAPVNESPSDGHEQGAKTTTTNASPSNGRELPETAASRHRSPPSGTLSQPPTSRPADKLQMRLRLPLPVHRSFLLDSRSDHIAHQMSLIEAELFSHVTWQELASGRWQTFRQDREVSDWEDFYRIRMREKAQADRDQTPWHGNHVGVLVARFNLVANWVASEVILTQSPLERAAVIAKFIRVAWKCYQVSNFASMTQIVFGLQSPWIERLANSWGRVPAWEMRILRDLRILTSPARNFRHMRRVMDVMISQEGLEEIVNSAGPPDVFTNPANATIATASSSAQTRGCIPFCGLLLMDLMENESLPTLLPPQALSSPTEDTSSTFASLPPPPAHLPTAPLVNVLKFRLLGMTIKTVIAFQQRARAYDFAATGALYLRCLKLRCLPAPLMTYLSHLAEA